MSLGKSAVGLTAQSQFCSIECYSCMTRVNDMSHRFSPHLSATARNILRRKAFSRALRLFDASCHCPSCGMDIGSLRTENSRGRLVNLTAQHAARPHRDRGVPVPLAAHT